LAIGLQSSVNIDRLENSRFMAMIMLWSCRIVNLTPGYSVRPFIGEIVRWIFGKCSACMNPVPLTVGRLCITSFLVCREFSNLQSM